MTSLDAAFYATLAGDFGPASTWDDIVASEAVAVARERAETPLPAIDSEGETTVNELIAYTERRAPFRGAPEQYAGQFPDWVTPKAYLANYGPDPFPRPPCG